jgi:hypothetical protein
VSQLRLLAAPYVDLGCVPELYEVIERYAFQLVASARTPFKLPPAIDGDLSDLDDEMWQHREVLAARCRGYIESMHRTVRHAGVLAALKVEVRVLDPVDADGGQDGDAASQGHLTKLAVDADYTFSPHLDREMRALARSDIDVLSRYEIVGPRMKRPVPGILEWVAAGMLRASVVCLIEDSGWHSAALIANRFPTTALRDDLLLSVRTVFGFRRELDVDGCYRVGCRYSMLSTRPPLVPDARPGAR